MSSYNKFKGSLNFTPIPVASILATSPFTVLSCLVFGSENVRAICWPIKKLPSVWIKTPPLLISWIKSVKEISPLELSTEMKAGYRGCLRNSLRLNVCQSSSCFQSFRRSNSGKTAMIMDSSFLFSNLNKGLLERWYVKKSGIILLLTLINAL